MKESSYVTLFIQKLSKELCDVFLPQGVIPLGGCVVSAGENVGMPFAIVVNLEDFSVRRLKSIFKTCHGINVQTDNVEQQINVKMSHRLVPLVTDHCGKAACRAKLK